MSEKEKMLRDDGDSSVTSFSPSDYLYSTVDRRKKNGKKRRRMPKGVKALLIAIPVLVCVLAVLLTVYIRKLRTDPASFFTAAFAAPTPVPTVSPTPEQIAAVMLPDKTAVPTPVPTPTATPTALELLQAQSDTDTMNNIINIALIGVDYAQERETWGGKHEYHADVIMVMAVNFTEKRVDLISIPRDTYAEIPGIKGIYKINASVNCGGGYDAEGGTGFLKTCEAASWMLDGIPVDYYYAVTMPAVKELVDIFGGVDYQLELSFSMAGRKYYRGQQHMNGQAVLDYLRVRKNIAKSGDNNRINRQKDMLVALFRQMQANDLILKIPDIIETFEGQLYTNCSLSQTAALAAFAYDLDADNIGMYSMDGRYTSIFGWNFTLTDQEKRVSIIKDVYGIDVPINWEYTETYARYRWECMLSEKYLRTTNKFKDAAVSAVKNGRLQSDPGGGAVENNSSGIPEVVGGTGDVTLLGYPGRMPLAERVMHLPGRTGASVLGYTQSGYDAYSGFITAYNDVQNDLEYAAKQAEKYVKGESNKFSSAVSSLSGANSRLRSYAGSCNEALGLNYSFSWSVSYWTDPDFNEIYVDFR